MNRSMTSDKPGRLAAAAVCAWSVWSIMAPSALSAVGADGQPDRERNIAKGARYTLSPAPDYWHCTDPEDTIQLTDGQLTSGLFWTHKGAVGWRSASEVIMTIDLGRLEPISGVSFRTAAGAGGVQWPELIRLLVSDDGESYRDLGDLMAMDRSAGTVLPDKYAVLRFAARQLRARGRYVRFVLFPKGRYSFVDEVEVFRGPDALLKEPPRGELIARTSIQEHYSSWLLEARVAFRYAADARGIEQAIKRADLAEPVRERLLNRLAVRRQELLRTRVGDARSFLAVLPFNTAHVSLLAIQAALWKELGRPALSAWAAPAWDPLDHFAVPPASAGGSIEVHTMRGEYRAAAFNLFNAADVPMTVRVRFEGLPGSPIPGYLTVHQVEWTGTVGGPPVAAALPEARRGDGAWVIDVVPGLARQVWLTFHVTGLDAGEYKGAIVVQADRVATISLPVRLQVYPITFPKLTTLRLGGWSYTNGRGRRGVTPDNRRLLVEHLRRRFVNSPWATAGVMMRFSFTGRLSGGLRLDTAQFDEWIEQWPEARTYFVFLAVTESFARTKMGTPAFNRRVGVWISAWVRHLGAKGIGPDRLALLLVDEPRSPRHADVIIAWARAIRAAEPRVLIWENPIYRRPAGVRPELFDACDLICLNRRQWLEADQSFKDFYLAQQQRGKTLQFYACKGPAKLLDPYSYYRLQAWHARLIGASGSFFWAFGESGGSSSWNEYAAAPGARPHTPLFLDDRSVTAGKHMEAIREGAEDYEYFVMLGEAVRRARSAGRSGPAVDRAESLLKTAAREVLLAPNAHKLLWNEPKDRSKADLVRVQLLQALSALAAPDYVRVSLLR